MHSQFHVGIVENRDDPLRLGRCQVRVFGVHSESLDDVPTASLPWAIPVTPINSASLSGIGVSPTGLVNGSLVLVVFQDPESKQMPIMLGSIPSIPQNQNSGLKGGVYEEGFSIGDSPSSATTSTTTTATPSTNLTTSDGTPVQSGTSETSSSSEVLGKPASAWKNSSLTRCNVVLKKFEGFRAEPYKDSAGIPTIGYGTTLYPNGTKVKMSDSSISKETAIEYVNYHIKNNVIPYIVSRVTVPITEAMFEALCSFVYNVGGGNFAKSTLLQLLNKKDYGGAGGQFAEWTKAGGQTLAGLVSRRKDEFALYKADGYPSNVSKDESEVSKPSEDTKEHIQSTPESAPEPTAPTAASMKDIILNANSLGFKDHSGKFPLKSLLKEPDTNRIFRRVSKGTLIDKKNQKRRNQITSGDGSIKFSEPRSPYNASYPYNRGFFTEAGHALEFDDTPGSERVQVYHTTGTFIEIDKFGTQVNKIIGDGYSIIERNGYLYVDGTARLVIGSDVKLSVGGNLNVVVSGDVSYDVGGSFKVKTGGDFQINSNGVISGKSTGNIALDGNKVYLNSDKAKTTSAYVGMSPNSIDYEPLSPESFIDGEVLMLEESDPDSVTDYYKDAVSTGKITQDELDKGTAATPEQKDETPAQDKTSKPKECGMFDSNNIPPTTQISKYFTIGNLSSNAAVSKYPIQAQHGLTIPQIACNLKTLAENSLDAIKSKYPNAFITSGFRAGSGTSQHERGEAADIQFTGASKSDYYEIAKWIKDNVVFDKLLLEYKTTGSGMPWIHISYRENPRKEVYTFMNHAKKSNGLADLSKA